MSSTSRAKQAADFLIAASVGAATGNTWPIKLGRLLDSPDAQIAITDAPGQQPNPRFLLEFPAIQIMVRGAVDDYSGGWDKIIQCKDVLLGMDPITLGNGDRWNGVTGMGDVNLLKWDEKSRPIFVSNYRIIFEPAASGLTNRESL